MLDGYLAGIDRSGKSTTDFIIDLNRRLSGDIAYRVRMEPGVQTPAETLQSRSGSCRDTGWLLVQILRRLGLATRFVSGYLIQLRPDIRPADGPGGAAEDFTDLHAWAEVYIPGAGWIGLDPTSGLLAGEGHIPLAATPSPGSAAPISGTHGKANVDFSVSMRVERIRETPRVTRPYSDEQWQSVLAVGDAVEARLKAGDVRLSVGGEPTFVALDDGLAPEWNIAALGPTKRVYADKLARRLRERLAPGGLLHYGLGKWYPGEQTARWAFAIYWRGDGEALWQDPALIALEEPARPADIDDAARFAAELSRRLGLAADGTIAAYEDWAHFVLIEQKLPLEVTPQDNRLDDPAQRERLVRVFDQGLRPPVGYVLPLLVAGARLRPPALPHRALGVSARAAVPGAGRLASGPAAASERPAGDHVPRLSRRAAHRSLRRPRQASAGRRPLGLDPGRRDIAPRRRRPRALRPTWCGRHWRSSRAAAICACSCRRSRTAGTTPR